jgi:hypothetical protein
VVLGQEPEVRREPAPCGGAAKVEIDARRKEKGKP